MASKPRRKAKDLKRRVRKKDPKKKLFVFSEGKNTEPNYLKAYEREISSTVIEVVYEKERGAPKTLLDLASIKLAEISSRKYKREFGKQDQVWLVFDKDEHDEVEQTLTVCREKGIKTAFSNPCFEVWLILHHEDYDRDEHRHETQKHCEKVCSGYDRKSRKLPQMDYLMNKVEDAEQRADKLEKARKTDGGSAPITTVHKLTSAMRRG